MMKVGASYKPAVDKQVLFASLFFAGFYHTDESSYVDQFCLFFNTDQFIVDVFTKDTYDSLFELGARQYIQFIVIVLQGHLDFRISQRNAFKFIQDIA